MKVKLTILFVLLSATLLAQDNANALKSASPIKRWFGISAGWVMKEVIVKDIYLMDESGRDLGITTEKQFGNAVQIGFSFAPSFGKYGLGLYTGLYYEHTWGSHGYNAGATDMLGMGYAYGSFRWSGEHALYLPLHFQYKHEFSRDMRIYASVDPSLEIGFSSSNYTSCFPIIYGGCKFGFQFYGVQLSMLTEWGVGFRKLVGDPINARPISIQLSYMF